MDKSACRLYAIFARAASTAVILRRGPSNWVQVIRWNTATDTFEPGHWFKGVIYTDRCDLSPSGQRFLYFAAKHYRRGLHTDPFFLPTWTAISRPPYLTAVALWPNRRGTYFGGGLFAADDHVQLNAHDLVYWGKMPESPHPNQRPPASIEIDVFPMPWHKYQRFDLTPEHLRFLRDGWTWHEGGQRRVTMTALGQRAADELPMPQNLYRCGGMPGHEPVVLHRQCANEGDSHYIHHGSLASARDELLEGVRWADFDQRGRMICAAGGKLFCVSPTVHRGAREWKELADFNDNKPDRLPPPDWATVW